MRIYPLLRPLFFALPTENAHALALTALHHAHSLNLIHPRAPDPLGGVTLMGLRFPNRVGLAAGFDKNARYIDALGALGFGCIEVGTVTPRPQPGQPRPRLFRVIESGALINRMGFPNEGAVAVAARLARRRFSGVCGVNIGKNAATPLAAAVDDYVECFRIVAPHADYVTINVSSPNTEGLRQLEEAEQLQPIVGALVEARRQLQGATTRRVPLLVKVSPDLAPADLVRSARLACETGSDGIIATNTTLNRSGIAQRWRARAGGLSGAPLRPLALQAVQLLRAALGAAVPIVAAGGIDSARHAQDAFDAGADLVQLYTGLIYRGPGLVREIISA
ncbi:MAG TPA: quinone-dependent dihydroorotate dehydrogenase [Steroidobacteraceae bacterium]|nr:quinone-dependent dihydroorotate dehydrogenase [Steroidobacteraceae bacterium]